MVPSLDPATFYTANAPHADRLMLSRGMLDERDRSDCYHNFMLDVLQRDTLYRADACGNPDGYLTQSLINHINGFYRLQEQHTKYDLRYLADYTTSTDSSAAIFTQLSIDEFRAWCPSRPALEACKEILEGKPESGSNYRAFQRHRNQFRKIHAAEVTENK